MLNQLPNFKGTGHSQFLSGLDMNIRFSTIFTRETMFATSSPFCKGVFMKRKEFASL